VGGEGGVVAELAGGLGAAAGVEAEVPEADVALEAAAGMVAELPALVEIPGAVVVPGTDEHGLPGTIWLIVCEQVVLIVPFTDPEGLAGLVVTPVEVTARLVAAEVLKTAELVTELPLVTAGVPAALELAPPPPAGLDQIRSPLMMHGTPLLGQVMLGSSGVYVAVPVGHVDGGTAGNKVVYFEDEEPVRSEAAGTGRDMVVLTVTVTTATGFLQLVVGTVVGAEDEGASV
jgi:hypothetical protein